MTILKPIKLLIITIILLIFNSSLFSQKLEIKDRNTEPEHTNYSKKRKRDYQLYIYFPKNYSTKDSISYPFFYSF